jgi:hemerythrin-like metal-binding protein
MPNGWDVDFGEGVPAARVPWDAQLDLGVPLMDSQHRELARLVNALESVVKDGEGGRELVHALLLELVDRASEHFRTEQDLMRQSRYPTTLEHDEEHERLLGRIARLREAHAGNKLELTVQVVRSLRPWLVTHIQGMDRDLALHLQHSQATP